MTIEEAQIALQNHQSCEYYSPGIGLQAWLDEGWHLVELQEVDPKKWFVRAYTHRFTIELRGQESITQQLRLIESKTAE